MTGCRIQPFAMQIGAGGGGGGDLGDGNIWDGATLAAAITAAGDDLADGDILRTSQAYTWQRALTGSQTYYRRLQLPLNSPTLTTAFEGVDPVAASVPNWNKDNGANGSYTVTDGVLTVASDGAGNTGRINYDDGASRLVGPSAITMEDLSATAAGATQASWPQLQLRSVDGPNLVFRPQGATAGSAWGISTTGGDVSIPGTAIGTPLKLDLWWDPRQSPTPVIIAIDDGPVLVAVLTLPSLTVGTASVVALAQYTSSTDQSISCSSFVLLEGV
jgi:hypothetical protein